MDYRTREEMQEICIKETGKPACEIIIDVIMVMQRHANTKYQEGYGRGYAAGVLEADKYKE